MSSFKSISELTKPCSKTLSFSQKDGESIAKAYMQFDEMALLPETEISIEALYKSLEEAKRIEIRSHLNSVTLSNYWHNSRIPAGLRLDKAPTGGLDDPVFLDQWEQVLSKCSMDLMLLLIQRSNTERELAAADISRIQTEITTNRAGPDVVSQLDKIEKAVKAYQQDLMQFKLKKYRKHTMDYARGSIYNWNPRPRRQPAARSGSRTRWSRRGFTDSEAESSDGAPSDREDYPSTSTETTHLQVPTPFPDERGVGRGGRGGRGKVRFEQQPRRRSPRRSQYQSAR